MKTPIKNLFPILLAGLGIIFASMVYFVGLKGTEHGIFTDAGSALAETTEQEITSGVLAENPVSETEIPAVKYTGGVRTVGEAVDFRELFQFTYTDGKVVSGTDETYVVMYLKGIADTTGKSVCSFLETEDIEAMEEISSPFVFDQEENILYFQKSGIFKMLIKVYYDANTYVEYEFSIPIEVG